MANALGFCQESFVFFVMFISAACHITKSSANITESIKWISKFVTACHEKCLFVLHYSATLFMIWYWNYSKFNGTSCHVCVSSHTCQVFFWTLLWREIDFCPDWLVRAPVFSTCYQGSQEEAVKGANCKCHFLLVLHALTEPVFLSTVYLNKIFAEVAQLSLCTRKQFLHRCFC